MTTDYDNVIQAFDTAACRRHFTQAEAAARRLAPHDQLLVVDSLRAAEARLNLRTGSRS